MIMIMKVTTPITTTVTMTKRINLSTLLNIQGVKVSISSKCIRYNDPCKNGVKCVNLPGNYRCDFKTGYTRNNCETGAQLPLMTMAMMMIIRKNSLLLEPLELILEQKLCGKLLLVTGNTVTMVNFMALKLINTTLRERDVTR